MGSWYRCDNQAYRLVVQLILVPFLASSVSDALQNSNRLMITAQGLLLNNVEDTLTSNVIVVQSL